MERKQINGGELWLSFARSRVKVLLATGLPYCAQSFVMPDGATVRVQILPGIESIALTGAPVSGYQFFTTGPGVKTTSSNPPHYKGYSLSVKLGPASEDPAQSLKVKASPRASSVEADAQDVERWKFLTGTDALSFGLHFPIKGSWQVQAANHHTFYPADDTGLFSTGVAAYPLLRSSWTNSNQLCNLTAAGGVRTDVQAGFDVNFDIAPALLRDGKKSPVGGGTAPDSDWYKRAAFKRVTHPEFGTRTIVVMTDISNRFHAFAVNDSDISLWDASLAEWPDQHSKTNIKPANTVSVDAPLPTWARVATTQSRQFSKDNTPITSHIGKLIQEVPQYRWAFNSACTRACVVVYEDIAGLPCDPPNAGHTPVRLIARGSADEAETEITESLPGLLELEINLALTGPDLGEFSFSLAESVALRPTADKRYIMAADYAWAIPGAPTSPGEPDDPGPARRDDLLLMLGEIYHASTERSAPANPAPALPYPNDLQRNLHCAKVLAVIFNHTQSRAVRTFVTSDTDLLYESTYRADQEVYSHIAGATTYRATGSFLAFDLRALAFVFQKRLIVTTPQSADDFRSVRDRVLFFRFGGGPAKAAVQLEVIHNNQIQEAKMLAPESALNAQLESVFGNTGVVGLLRFPVDDIGQHTDSLPQNAYDTMQLTSTADGMGLSYIESLYGDYPLGFRGAAPFNAGAYLYSVLCAPALRMADPSVFALHPDGRWSVVTRPSICYSGESSYEQKAQDFDLSLMRQDYIDIINLRHYDKKTKLWSDKRSTHLDAFNRAFDKSLTRADYLYTFELEAGMELAPAWGVEFFNTYLIAKNGPDVMGRFLVSMRTSADESARAMPLLERPCDFDTLTSEFAQIGSQWLMRGASLFY